MRLNAVLFSLFLVIGLLLVSSNEVSAQSQSTSGSIFYGGNAYSHNISDEDLVNTPSWNPEKGDPPVSLRTAVQIARVNLSRFVKKADGFDVEKIELRQMGIEKWLYEVAFHCWKDKCRDDAGSSFRIYIKMDGSVIDPEITPEPKQK